VGGFWYLSVMKDIIKNILRDFVLNEQPKPSSYWNYETLKDEAKKYNKRTDFIRKSPTAYQISQEMGIYDEITTHMPKVKTWTPEELRNVASQYTNMTDFSERDKGAYLKARRLGILDDITSHFVPKKRKITKDNFEEFAREVHGDKYNYDKTNYISTRGDVTITCPKHGDFIQTAGAHLGGRGCPKCASEIAGSKKSLSQEEFIERSKKANNNQYDYSKSEYVPGKKVIVTCPIHGDFLTNPANHMRGSGCPECYGTKKISTQEFIDRARKVHGDTYDYSKSNYLSSEKPIEIICKTHGPFLQLAGNHLKGDNCPKCAGRQKSNTQEFIEKSKLIHGDRFNYDKVEYQTNKIPVVITCPKPGHGDFVMKPNAHLSGQGCPVCSESRGEKLVSLILQELDIPFTRQAKFKDCTNLKTGRYCRKLPFDFYLPTYNTVIEFDGIQHFREVGFWGGSKSLQTQQTRDQIKNQYCQDKGINMIRIPYTMDKDDIPSFIKEKLSIQ
jgi:hypothetical protein